MSNNITLGKDLAEPSVREFKITLERGAWEVASVTISDVATLAEAKAKAIAQADTLDWTMGEDRSDIEIAEWESPAGGILG
jgi:hypothetical protein